VPGCLPANSEAPVDVFSSSSSDSMPVISSPSFSALQSKPYAAVARLCTAGTSLAFPSHDRDASAAPLGLCT
jgi:hypothetical protein